MIVAEVLVLACPPQFLSQFAYDVSQVLTGQPSFGELRLAIGSLFQQAATSFKCRLQPHGKSIDFHSGGVHRAARIRFRLWYGERQARSVPPIPSAR